MPLAALIYLSTSFLVVISLKMLIHALLYALSYSYLKTEKKKKSKFDTKSRCSTFYLRIFYHSD